MTSQGILLETHHAPFRPTVSLFGMQQGLTATDNGAWIDGRTIKDGSLEFLNDGSGGTFTSFAATVMGSNAKNIPANSTDGATIQTASALGIVALAGLARWIKVKVTAISVSGGDSLGVRLHAHNY